MTIAIARGRERQRYGASDFSVRMDPEIAGDIRAFAIRHNMSFAEAVRTLCTWGLDAEKGAA